MAPRPRRVAGLLDDGGRGLVARALDAEDASSTVRGTPRRCSALRVVPLASTAHAATAFREETRWRISVYGAVQMPRSVMMPAMKRCGVTSKAGLRTWRRRRRADVPPTCVTSRALRSSIGMPLPSAVVEIDGRQRGGDVERDAVLAGQDGDAVGADLVRGVAVGGDAVGADDHEIDWPVAHQRARHVVGDDRRVDAVAAPAPTR